MLNNNEFVYSVQQIREMEKLASAGLNLNADILMERAGKAAWRELQKKWPKAQKICVICGKGNNGGDGYVLALAAHEAGLIVKVLYLQPPEQLHGAALKAAQKCVSARLELDTYAWEKIDGAEVIVDAILGIGLSGVVNAEFTKIINEINTTGIPVLALDIPSGLEGDEGRVLGTAIKSDLTVTFLGNKIGFYLQQGPNLVGEVVVDYLAIPASVIQRVSPAAQLLNLEKMRAQNLRPRSQATSKFDYGYVVVLGGNYGMAGAARMAGEAALRVGAGIVNVITRKNLVTAINSARPELMCRGYWWFNKFFHKIDSILARATVIIVGPGLGKTSWSRRLLKIALHSNKPLVVDADGLNLLAEMFAKGEVRKISPTPNWILTPHVVEASRLLNISSAAIAEDLVGAANLIQQKYGGVCVLKSARSVICGSVVQTSGDIMLNLPSICPYGNPGMATAGMGDILSGVLGGLLAQKIPQLAAAKLGVALHAAAGDAAALEYGECGLLASDLLPFLRRLVNYA